MWPWKMNRVLRNSLIFRKPALNEQVPDILEFESSLQTSPSVKKKSEECTIEPDNYLSPSLQKGGDMCERPGMRKNGGGGAGIQKIIFVFPRVSSYLSPLFRMEISKNFLPLPP